MHVSILGATEVRAAAGPLEITSLKLRQIVAGLAAARGRTVSYDALVDLLWGQHPPDGLPGTLHAYIAALRKLLEPDRAPRAPAQVLVTVGTGYALRLPEGGLDAERFEQAVREVDRRLERPDPTAAPHLDRADLERCEAEVERALGLWRGEPYADLDGRDAVSAERVRLGELRLLALEHRATLLMALGAHPTAAAELQALTSAHPLRERLWLLRAQALQADGRQADALAVLRDLRDLLDEQLGIEPSGALRDLEVRILRQDPSLAWGAPPGEEATGRAPAPAATGPGGPERLRPRLPDWPLAGRRDELATLVDLLGPAETGRPTFAAVTGEPGIGKSRLCAELAAVAVDRGARLLVGRCSQDDGAPPLWPWQQVVRGLGQELAVEPGGDEGAGFRTWDAIVHQLLQAAQDELLVVVLDDLHWADAATLRVLRLLVESATAGRIAVVVTWREHPAPAGALADVADALARAHAARIPLVGLTAADAGELVAAVSSQAPTADEAAELARRTDGNPFYVVEFARLARDAPLGPLTATTPVAVQDVVGRRIARLPDRAALTLRHAGVVGRAFDLPAVVAALGPAATEDDVLDDLDRAVAAGLVREEGADRWSFGHALVRDAAYEGLGATRAARAHARVASLMAELGGRGSEVARHWVAAGPAHARSAWQAAMSAAHEARTLHAHEEAARLLRDALARLAEDPEADEDDRYRLLLELGEAERWSGQWERLREASEEALLIAERAGDPDRIAEAASAMTRGAFWQTTSYGETHHRQVAALRAALATMPTADSRQRCLLLSCLAMETYYLTGHQERAALVAEARAMAHRLADDGLVVDTSLMGFVSLWRQDTARERLAFVEEAAELARAAGDAHRMVIAHTLRTVVLGELGRIERMWESEAAARAEAERLRVPYGSAVLDGLIVPWLAMAGRAEEAAAALERMTVAVRRVVLFQDEEALLGAVLSLQTWCGDVGDLVAALIDIDGRSPLPSAPLVAQAMVRCGRVEEARRYLAEHPVELPDGGDWFTPLLLGAAAESALWVGERDLAAQAYRLLAPGAGMTLCAGSGVAQGPVDAFLALAAAAVGERETASRHADDADALLELWAVPRCAAWFAGLRTRFGF